MSLTAVWRWRQAHGVPAARWREPGDPAPDPLLAWLAEQYEPVTARQAARWAGITTDAARRRLDLCGAVSLPRVANDPILWVAP